MYNIMPPKINYREKSNKRSNTKSKKINEPKTKNTMKKFIDKVVAIDDSNFSPELKQLIHEEKERQVEEDKEERERNIKMIYGNVEQEELERLERIKGIQERVAKRLKEYNEKKDRGEMKNEELKKEELLKIIDLPKEERSTGLFSKSFIKKTNSRNTEPRISEDEVKIILDNIIKSKENYRFLVQEQNELLKNDKTLSNKEKIKLKACDEKINNELKKLLELLYIFQGDIVAVRHANKFIEGDNNLNEDYNFFKNILKIRNDECSRYQEKDINEEIKNVISEIKSISNEMETLNKKKNKKQRPLTKVEKNVILREKKDIQEQLTEMREKLQKEEKEKDKLNDKLYKRRQEEKNKIIREKEHQTEKFKKELAEELHKQYMKDLEQIKEHNRKKEKAPNILVKKIKENKINTEYKDDIHHLKYIRERLAELRKLKRMDGGTNKELINSEIKKHENSLKLDSLSGSAIKEFYTKDGLLKLKVSELRSLVSSYVPPIFKGIRDLTKEEIQNKLINSEWWKTHEIKEEKKKEPEKELEKHRIELYKPISTKRDLPPNKELKKIHEHLTKIDEYKKYICQQKKIYNIKCNTDSKKLKRSDTVSVVNDDLVKYINYKINEVENQIHDIKKPNTTLLSEKFVDNVVDPVLHELSAYPKENKELIERIEECKENKPTAPELVERLKDLKEDIIISQPQLIPSEPISEEVMKLHPVELLKFEPNGKRLDLGHTIVNMYCGSHDPNQMIPAHIAHTALEYQKLPSPEKIQHENIILESVLTHNKEPVKKYPPVQT
jgi:hypothetical protein